MLVKKEMLRRSRRSTVGVALALPGSDLVELKEAEQYRSPGVGSRCNIVFIEKYRQKSNSYLFFFLISIRTQLAVNILLFYKKNVS